MMRITDQAIDKCPHLLNLYGTVRVDCGCQFLSCGVTTGLMRSLILALALTGSCLVSVFSPAAERPNIVFFLVDDLGKMDLSIEGSTFYETPNIDSIAKAGIRFDHGYSTCQVCSPSRVSVQTGKYPARLRITDYIAINRGNQPERWGRNTKLLPAEYHPDLPLEEVTIAEALKGGGYTTFFAGKWHLGDKGFGPLEQGYDVNVGGHHAGTPPGGYFSPYRNPSMDDGPDGEELPIRLGADTARFITEKAAQNKPFFAMLSYYSVHGPIQSTEQRWKKYQAKAKDMGLTERSEPRFILDRTQEVRQVQDHPVYAGMMEALDESVGLVLKAIHKAGIQDNTIVIFTSDNGGVSSGDGYSTSCLPMRGGKGRQWEGGIRQPYYIYWPGVTDGQRTDVPATGADFYPTILEMAGLPLMPNHHLDGVSLVPVMKGEPIAPRSLYWHYPHYGNQGGEPSSIIRDQSWKLIHYFEDGRNELYNLMNDEGEMRDVSEVYPDITGKLLANLKKWHQSINADFPTQNPKWDQEKYDQFIENKKASHMPNREKQHARFLDPDFSPGGGWWQSAGSRD